MSNVVELANFCIRFYNAVRTDPIVGRASTQEQYKTVMTRGYSSVCAAHPQVGRAFLNLACASTWQELDQAATRYVRETGWNETGRLGTRDFLGVGWRLGQLDLRISQAARARNPPVPHQQTGFDTLSLRDRDRGRILAENWRMAAARIPDQGDFSRVPADMKNFYRGHVEAAQDIYEAATFGSDHLVTPARAPLFQHLHSSPWDYWGAYKAALFPAQRQMAQRLAMSILAGHNPYSGEPPPSSAGASLLSTMGQGLTGR